MGRRVVDLTGERFGRLVVREFAGCRCVSKKLKQRAAWWTCDCDCGGTLTTRASSLKVGYTKSCGCLSVDTRHESGKFVPLPDGIGAMRHVYRNYRYSAKKRGIEFYITYEEATTLFKKRCHYCGNRPSQKVPKDYQGNHVYNGIDRVDNAGPYSIENCVPCCGMCNRAKGKYTVEQFMEWVDRVHKNLHAYSI